MRHGLLGFLVLICVFSTLAKAADLPPLDSDEWTEILVKELPFLPRPLVEMTSWDKDLTIKDWVALMERKHHLTVEISKELKRKDGAILMRRMGVGPHRRPLYQALDEFAPYNELNWEMERDRIRLNVEPQYSERLYDVRSILSAGWPAETLESFIKSEMTSLGPSDGSGSAIVRGPVLSLRGTSRDHRHTAQVLRQIEHAPLPFIPGDTSRDAALKRLLRSKVTFSAKNVTMETLAEQLGAQLHVQISVDPSMYGEGMPLHDHLVSIDLLDEPLQTGIETIDWSHATKLVIHVIGGEMSIDAAPECDPVLISTVHDISGLASQFASTDDLFELIRNAGDSKWRVTGDGDGTLELLCKDRMLIRQPPSALDGIDRLLKDLTFIVKYGDLKNESLRNEDWQPPDDIVLRTYNVSARLDLDDIASLIPKFVSPGTWHAVSEGTPNDPRHLGSIGIITMPNTRIVATEPTERKLLVRHRRSVQAEIKKLLEEIEHLAPERFSGFGDGFFWAP